VGGTVAITAQNDPLVGLCQGTVWLVNDRAALVTSLAKLLIGRTDQALQIIDGGTPTASTIRPALLAELRRRLRLRKGQKPWHRDALLFELMTWVVASTTASGGHAVSSPHLKSTFQGTDGIRIDVEPEPSVELDAHIYESKCTKNPKSKFDNEIIEAFKEYLSGSYDDEITQKVLALLQLITSDGDRIAALLDDFEIERRYHLHACLTIEGGIPLRSALFAKYGDLSIEVARRNGHTFDSPKVRAWFAALARDVLKEIEMVATCSTKKQSS
jgi:hypothetical protein